MSISLRIIASILCLLTLSSAALVPPSVSGRAANHAQTGAVCTPETVAFYDGRLGGLPDTQGMQYQALNRQTGVVSATQTFTNGATILDTLPQRGDFAGYFAKSGLVPPLDRTTGYTLTFGLQLQVEEHTSNDRAGLSILALGSDARGIELAFWSDRIWAQDDGTQTGMIFTHAEEGAFSTTGAVISYTLTIHGDAYALSASNTAILTGTLRDYTAFNTFPYTSPNIIFVGDNTSRARATIKLTTAAVTATECAEPQYPVFLPLIDA